MKIGFVGGDLRQLTLLECFKNEGYEVKIYGYDGVEESVCSFDEIEDCEVLVLPLPTISGEYVFAPMTDKKIHIGDLNLKNFRLIFFAGANELLNKKLVSSGALCVNYLKNEELTQKNVIATAEGALKIAMEETAETVFGCKVLITGFGKVAKYTAKLFKQTGADVTVVARRKEVLAEAYCEGYRTDDFGSLSKIAAVNDIIINTVPSEVIDADVLKSIKDNALIIDLASKPGGVDFESAKKNNKRVIWALSLPGKVAPVTSGKIIFDTISGIIKERSVADGFE